MNYDDARERIRKDTGESAGFHYTRANDGRLWAIGECANHEPHPTKGEAYECYRRYLIAQDWREFSMSSQMLRCAAKVGETRCGEFSQGGLSLGWAYLQFALCPEHRGKDVLESLVKVGASWHS